MFFVVLFLIHIFLHEMYILNLFSSMNIFKISSGTLNIGRLFSSKLTNTDSSCPFGNLINDMDGNSTFTTSSVTGWVY